MGSFSLEENKFVLAGVEVDPTTQRIRRDEQVERIEPRMMQVLLMLARQAGEVVTREALEREVWGGVSFLTTLSPIRLPNFGARLATTGAVRISSRRYPSGATA